MGSCPDGQSRSPYTTHRCLPARTTLTTALQVWRRQTPGGTCWQLIASQEAQALRTKLFRHPLVVLVAKAVRADQRGVGPVDDGCLPARAASQLRACSALQVQKAVAQMGSRKRAVKEDLPAARLQRVQQRLGAVRVLNQLDDSVALLEHRKECSVTQKR